MLQTHGEPVAQWLLLQNRCNTKWRVEGGQGCCAPHSEQSCFQARDSMGKDSPAVLAPDHPQHLPSSSLNLGTPEHPHTAFILRTPSSGVPHSLSL